MEMNKDNSGDNQVLTFNHYPFDVEIEHNEIDEAKL